MATITQTQKLIQTQGRELLKKVQELIAKENIRRIIITDHQGALAVLLRWYSGSVRNR